MTVPNALQTWKATATRAVFFLDAIDEAWLEGHDLERVLLRFAQEVDPATRSLQLVLSSRNGLWTPADNARVVRTLALASENPPIRILRLEPLSLEDVRLYAKANGVGDSDAFVTAIRRDELEQVLLDMRPPDARVLVDYWRHHGGFGTWSEMLEASIEASVRNENRRHADEQQFTLEEARTCLARLAAATVLGKRSAISLPGASGPDEVSAERLFADRRPASTSQLLTMGLFVQKGLHSVQLQQGAPTDYLAAAWLGERARLGWNPRALEDTLFVTPFGAGRTLIAPSRSAVVGWAAGRVPILRRRLLEDMPHVLLFEGDPSKLSRGECIEALRAVVAEIKSGRYDPSPTRGTVRQIAKHGVADAIVRLLSEFAGTARAVRLLLRIAEEGRYPEVAAKALAIALTPGVDESVGDVAIRAVAAAGSAQQRAQLLTLTTHSSEWMRVALVQSLAPETLNGAALVQLVVATTGRDVAYILGHALTKLPLADIDSILVALTPTLTSSITTSATEAHLEVAATLVVARLTRDAGAVPGGMPALLLAIESHLGGPLFVSREVVDALGALLVARVDLRRAVWDARIAAARTPEAIGRVMSAKLGPALAEDLCWLWAKRAAVTDEALKNALTWPLREALGRMVPVELAEFMAREDVAPGLKAFVDAREAMNAEADATRREWEAKQAAEEAALRAKNVAEVEPMRAEIEAGRNGNALVWGWQRLTGTNNRRGRLGTGRLVEAVGPELAEVFVTGFQRWWRRHEPPLPQPGSNSILLVNLAGLTGISLEVERGLDFARLADHEVERAARYALYELNGFPLWFDALVAARPSQVRPLLEKVVHQEWIATVENHGVIARAPYEPPATAELVRELVIAELERDAPGHARTVHHAVGALLLSTPPGRDVASILERYADPAAEGDVQQLAEWLRGWSHCAPEKVVKSLLRLAASNESRFLEVVEPLAALLEEDFDERGRPIATAGWTPAALEAWVRMLHVAVRPEHDIDRSGGGVYSPGSRDRAQSFRERCVSRLARNPSQAAFEALRRIRASKEMKPYYGMVDGLVLAQLTVAAENLATPWTEDDVLAVERGDERPPRTNGDLFALLRRHLVRVAELLENDDFSYAMLFNEKTDEREVQRWVASCLTLVSRGLYTVEREPEVQDEKLMDISVTVPGIGRVPVEIKPLYATRYSYRQLKAFVSEQLVGRYMRPAAVDRGIFLLVPLKARRWRVDGRVLAFDGVRAKLEAHARRVGGRAYKEVAVVCVDIARARAKKQSKERGLQRRTRRA
jgi:hypothetical protein